MKTVLRKQVKSVAALLIWFSLFIPISQSHQGHGLELESEPDQRNLQNLDEFELEDADDDEETESFEYEEEEIPGHEDLEGEAEENEEDEDEDINAEDLTEIVTKLEREAHEEEQRGLLPQIFSFLKGALTPGTEKPSKIKPSNQKFGKPSHQVGGNKVVNEVDGQIDLPEDLSDLYFQDDVLVDDITDGIEESLFLSGCQEGQNSDKNETMESRQLAVYLFQGQYLAEPRLNTFIDGAIRNLATEMKTAVMEPIYFRVLPRGRVVGRAKPIKRFPGVLGAAIPVGGLNTRRRRKKPLRGNRNRVRRRRRRRRRRRPLRGRREADEGRQNRRRRRKKKPGANQQQRRRRRRRRQRRPRQGVGGGRVEGLSKVVRDGDAEMQLFGNHTLIRSHMNMGPIELIMQFRTRRGLRRTGATLPRVKIHTVTRVNMDGSEMMDFLLDRPHPEAIQVRGRLFPMAERLAQNIFSRLFAPGSFLVSRIREKSGLAFLSRPGMTVHGRGI